MVIILAGVGLQLLRAIMAHRRGVMAITKAPATRMPEVVAAIEGSGPGKEEQETTALHELFRTFRG